MSVFSITDNGVTKEYDPEKLNGEQMVSYKEAVVVEREMRRYSYLAAILEERKKALLAAIVKHADKEEDSDKEET